MPTNTSLASRLREVYLNGRWIANTNLQELLQDVTWEQATHKPGNLNSIAALTYHLNYYLAGLLSALETGKLEISDKYSFDLAPMESEADWQQLRSAILDNAEKFTAWVEQTNDHLLCQPFFDEKYGTYERNIEGVIEHSYYHLGQISLLKKLIAGSSV